MARRLLMLFALACGLAACGEPMEFQNAGSAHTLAQDEAACTEELNTAPPPTPPPQIDPLQACMERKGWTRVR